MKIKYAQIMYHVKYTGSRLSSYNWPQDSVLPGHINSNLSILVPIHENKHSIDVHLKIENLMELEKGINLIFGRTKNWILPLSG